MPSSLNSNYPQKICCGLGLLFLLRSLHVLYLESVCSNLVGIELSSGADQHTQNGGKDKLPAGCRFGCLDPSGPQPVILMSQGRSGSTVTWQVLGNLSGYETPSNELTGQNLKESVEFFKEKDSPRWMMNHYVRHFAPHFLSEKVLYLHYLLCH